MQAVNKCFTFIQGKDMLLSTQNEELQELASTIKECSGLIGPLSGVELLSLASSENYICYDGQVRNVRGISRARLSRQAERDEENAPAEALAPPVLPHKLAQLRPMVFNNMVRKQRDRLRLHSKRNIEKVVQKEFAQFCKYVLSTENGAIQIAASKQCKEFENAWRSFRAKHKERHRFSAGLSTIFPGTASVEADFSVINWGKDKYRQALTDVFLEGILQAKQHRTLVSLSK
ncbi:Arginyl-tRNA--protein transferase 1 [Gracilaria domingensis]|nr:Arginyl-tRNA--protein transferase 1 [Gracilaria domingensis]